MKRVVWLSIGSLLALTAGAWWALRWMTVMPGESHAGNAEPSGEETSLAAELERDVRALAEDAGERHVGRPEGLEAAITTISARFHGLGYDVQRQEFQVRGVNFANLEVELPGRSRRGEIVVVGAHYDTAEGTPGADDNASGVAALLALADRLYDRRGSRTLRFVAFANEEPPFFGSAGMGSAHYARRSADRGENVVAMLSLESLGYYSDAPGSQSYPFPFSLVYPDRGDFVAFVGDVQSRDLVRRTTGVFRRHARIASEGLAAPRSLPGVSWSDQTWFWREGYDAVMVTGTAPYRNPAYHTRDDLPDRLDYVRLARAVLGLEAVIADLAERN